MHANFILHLITETQQKKSPSNRTWVTSAEIWHCTVCYSPNYKLQAKPTKTLNFGLPLKITNNIWNRKCFRLLMHNKWLAMTNIVTGRDFLIDATWSRLTSGHQLWHLPLTCIPSLESAHLQGAEWLCSLFDPGQIKTAQRINQTHPSAFPLRPVDNLEFSVSRMFKIHRLWEEDGGGSTSRTNTDMARTHKWTVGPPVGIKTNHLPIARRQSDIQI